MSIDLREWMTELAYDALKPGDIVIANVRFAGNTGSKPRPFIIAYKEDDRVFGFQITSKNENENFKVLKVDLEDYTSYNLTKPSYIVISRLVYVRKDFISEKVLGHISEKDLQILRGRFGEILTIESSINYKPGEMLDILGQF